VPEWRPWHLRCLVKRGMAIIAQERSTAKLEARTRREMQSLYRAGSGRKECCWRGVACSSRASKSTPLQRSRALQTIALGVWAESCACSNRPKGEKRTAQGFSPGNHTQIEIAPKGRPGAMRHSQKCDTSILPFGRPFRAILFPYAFPGLKAWAIVFSPFGRSAERPNYSGRCKHRLQGAGNAQTTSGRCNPPRRTLQNFSHWIEMLWR